MRHYVVSSSGAVLCCVWRKLDIILEMLDPPRAHRSLAESECREWREREQLILVVVIITSCSCRDPRQDDHSESERRQQHHSRHSDSHVRGQTLLHLGVRALAPEVCHRDRHPRAPHHRHRHHPQHHQVCSQCRGLRRGLQVIWDFWLVLDQRTTHLVHYYN